MALPVLILAPIAAFIGGIVSKFLDGLITLASKKFLFHAALIAFFVAVYSAFVFAINGLISQLDLTNIPQILIDGFAILPTNTDDCIGIIIAGHLAAQIYHIQNRILVIRSS